MTLIRGRPEQKPVPGQAAALDPRPTGETQVDGKPLLPKTPPEAPDAPAGTRPEGVFERVTHKLSHVLGHQDPAHPRGPQVITHERPVAQSGVFVGLFEVGYTLSEINQVRQSRGTELVHVVNPDGSSNLELVLARFQPEWLKKVTKNLSRIELQGPAINTSLTPGESPVGLRLLGIGLTGDLNQKLNGKDALSYTLEIKLSEKSLAALANLCVPGVAAEVLSSVGNELLGDVGEAVADIFVGAIPVVSAGLALISTRRAVQVCQDPKSDATQKAFAIAHAVADAVRVVLPLPGTLMNVALVGAALGRTAFQLHSAQIQARREQDAPKTGPPVGDDTAKAVS